MFIIDPRQTGIPSIWNGTFSQKQLQKAANNYSRWKYKGTLWSLCSMEMQSEDPKQTYSPSKPLPY